MRVKPRLTKCLCQVSGSGVGRCQEAGGTLAHCSSQEQGTRAQESAGPAWSLALATLPGHLAPRLATPELLILEQNVLREQKWAAQWSLGPSLLPVLLLTPGRQH